MSWGPRRRFWRTATVRPADGGFAIELDARPLNTPAGAPLSVPSAALAEASAAEWDALEAAIAPARLPLTRAANAAIDRVAPRPEPVVDAIAAYGASDLLCYRAATPEALAERQAAGWDPWLRWAARRHLPRVEGHRAGIDSVRDVVETSARLGIDVLTLYAFSVDNWKRPRAEVSTLMLLLKRYIRSELGTLNRNNIRFAVIGRPESLAPDVQDELDLGISAGGFAM